MNSISEQQRRDMLQDIVEELSEYTAEELKDLWEYVFDEKYGEQDEQ